MRVPRALMEQPTLDNLAQWLYQNSKCLSGNVSFGTEASTSDQSRNIFGYPASGTTPATPDTDFSVQHNFGHVAMGWVLLSLDQPVAIYRSPTAWTKTTAYFRCSTASANYVLLVV